MNFRFYHLDSNPFATHALGHLFWNAMHQSVWDGLLERIDARLGIIGVLGQSGLGKSTLLQIYRSSVDPKYVHVIDGIDMTHPPDEILANLARACGITFSSATTESPFSAIYQHCQAVHACGRQMVLLIDDADTLSITALRNVHDLFERLHREDEPLLQIVLCGRPELQQRCCNPDLYLFEQALKTALTLSPLAEEDRAAYIQHTLQSASTQTTQIFTKGALKLIVDETHGIPKMINITCSDVLVAGLLAGEQPISAATAQSVLGDDAVRIAPVVRWGLVSAVGLCLVAGIWTLWPDMPPASPYLPATATSQAPSAAPLPALRPQTATASSRATTTPRGAETVIREFRQRQQLPNAVLNTTEASNPPATNSPTAPVVPAAFGQMKSEPRAPRRGDHNAETRQHQMAHARTPLVASDKARLLCAMPRTGGQFGSDIVLLGHTRHGVHRLVDDGSQNMSPSLSPDGTHLAYTSYRGGAPNIYLRNLASGRETQLTFGLWLALPGAWSPNGRYLSLSQSVNGNNDIFIYDMMQQRLRRLTQHKGIDVSPSFAPDSQRLVFSSDRTGSPQLYLTGIAGTPPVRLTRTGTYNTSPSWSPQDETIAFVGRGNNKALNLYTIKSDGTQRQRLTQGQRFHTSPAWSPDGHTLMGMSLRNTVWKRHLVHLQPDRVAPTLPKSESLCLAPQWVAYRAR